MDGAEQSTMDQARKRGSSIKMGDNAGAVYEVSAIDVGSATALDVGAGSSGAIQNSGPFQSTIAYKSLKEHEIHRKPINDGKANDNVLVTAYPGRNLYSGVTAA